MQRVVFERTAEGAAQIKGDSSRNAMHDKAVLQHPMLHLITLDPTP